MQRPAHLENRQQQRDHHEPHQRPHQPPPHGSTGAEDPRDFAEHRRESLLLTADGHPSLPLHVLLPKAQSKERRPGLIAIHGHGDFGYDTVAGCDQSPEVAAAIAASNYDYGRQLVRRGFVVACPCLTPFGRRLGNRESYRQQDPCGITFVRMQLLGKVLIAENLRDCLWSLEYLARHGRVDTERLGCVGLSYGGRMSMLTAALEPRIRAAVVSGALNVMQERIMGRYSCGAQVIPGLLQIGDVPEIGSLVAPRPCVWETGRRDGLIVSPWADTAWERMQSAYRALGAEEQLLRDRFEGGHRWNGEVAVPLLESVLHA